MDYGLLGRKLSHSYSPKIHKAFGNYDYSLKELEPEELGDYLLSGAFKGLNVTIPYKKDVLPYCHELSPAARRIGAVNTIVNRGGKIVGHNTDYFGFSSMVARSGLSLADKKVLVLGSGGASATVVAVCEDLGANVVVISRSGENNYDNLHLHVDASVIVNATPVGMYPNVGVSPISLDLFPALEGVLDLIYNPARTQLLLDAESKGLIAENGLWMLVAQAKESAEWFIDNSLPDEIIENVYRSVKSSMENIILIGMPGCGKSTIGKLLAEMTGLTFVDADREIIAHAGMTIPEIFAKHKEVGFRKIETQVLGNLGMGSGQVIATGGGCVTKQENYLSLHQNGTIVWIKRELGMLATDGRPLSQINSLDSMYAAREPLYRQFADIIVENEGAPQATAKRIIAKLNAEEST